MYEQITYSQLPSYFWRALLVFRNDAFKKLLDDFLVTDVELIFQEGSFRNSVDIVDCYLEKAIAEGWMDDEEDTQP